MKIIIIIKKFNILQFKFGEVHLSYDIQSWCGNSTIHLIHKKLINIMQVIIMFKQFIK